ncbi:uncharacterized protein LOC132190248 [Corylus avellana]|uniref:uncharacterized protein LOC132190248 n=1 Tax=Corylus avellana TaxID=13451 RepID=UPI001E233278|nr:uncharacterized protein LOC132190248 [Corylus avellana]
MKKLGTVQNEDVNEKVYTHVRNKEKEKERKKKKAKLEINDNEKEFEKAREKDKRINDGEEVGELREVSKETNMIGEENMNVRMNDNKDSELGIRREKKKKHRVEKRVASYMNELLENNNNMEELVKGQAYSEKREKDERKDGKEEKKKEKKKRKRDMESCDVLVNNCVTGGDVGKERELSDGKNLEKANPFKKRRKENKSHNDDLGIGLLETITEKPSNESKGVEDNGVNARSSRNKMGERIVHAISAVDGDKDVKQKKNKKKKEEKKKRKAKSDKQVSEQNDDKRVARTKKGVENIYENSTPGGTSKKVRFSDHLEEVFTLSDGPSVAKNDDNDGLVRGKRFSQEEDEMVKKAVFDYIAVHGLGDEGLNMVLHCKSHSEIKNCWKEIGTALPWRPSESVYHRAHVLFERGENRKWTPEEYELIRSYHEKHGSKWKKLADKLGKHRFHVKDTWRRIRLPNMKKGRWEQEEYQTLFDLVNMDLRMKALEEKKKKNWKQGMLRDDLSWEAISNKLGTRSSVLCCQKWYNQLTSPMVREGVWANTDDYHLIDALYNLDACCIQDVDWDNLLEDRSGDVCRERWDQMVKHIGEHGSKSFPEQVEILSQRYCTDVLEARENCDRKPEV